MVQLLMALDAQIVEASALNAATVRCLTGAIDVHSMPAGGASYCRARGGGTARRARSVGSFRVASLVAAAVAYRFASSGINGT